MDIIRFDQVARLLERGRVGIMPTDTVYGLVALAADPHAVGRFYALKNREQKPGTLIAANESQLIHLGVPQTEIDKVSRWWPNPLSAVLPVDGHGYLHQHVGTLAMRITADIQLAELLHSVGPIITSSANQPGQPPATTIEEAIAYFGDDVDFYVDGGTIRHVLPSTIVRPTADGVEVLRQGGVTL